MTLWKDFCVCADMYQLPSMLHLKIRLTITLEIMCILNLCDLLYQFTLFPLWLHSVPYSPMHLHAQNCLQSLFSDETESSRENLGKFLC